QQPDEYADHRLDDSRAALARPAGASLDHRFAPIEAVTLYTCAFPPVQVGGTWHSPDGSQRTVTVTSELVPFTALLGPAATTTSWAKSAEFGSRWLSWATKSRYCAPVPAVLEKLASRVAVTRSETHICAMSWSARNAASPRFLASSISC